MCRYRQRASENSHFVSKRHQPGNHVFVGDKNLSQLFEFAVPLVKTLSKQSLLYRMFRTSLENAYPQGKHWSSYLRSCRMICDLSTPDGFRRASIIREAILARNDFDLLNGL